MCHPDDGGCSCYRSKKAFGMQADYRLKNFDGQYFQIKRGTQNYHQIVQQREQQSCSSYCGSSIDTEKKFCKIGSTCPINGLGFYNRSTNFILSNSKVQKNYSENWVLAYSSNENSNPIANFHISLSRPCGEITSPYLLRDVWIKYFNEPDSCSYLKSNSKFHSGYIDSGFRLGEYNVLQENNNILNQLPNYMPVVNTTELLKNNYKIFYKPYALWKTQCQQTYTTSDVEEMAKPLGIALKTILPAFVMACILLGLDVFMAICHKGCTGETRTENTIKSIRFWLRLIPFMQSCVRLLALIGVTICEIITVNGVSRLTQGFLDYATQNNCSEDVLQYAIEQFSEQRYEVLMKSGLCLAFCLIQIVTSILYTLFYIRKYGKYNCLESFKCCKRKPRAKQGRDYGAQILTAQKMMYIDQLKIIEEEEEKQETLQQIENKDDNDKNLESNDNTVGNPQDNIEKLDQI